MHIFLIIINKMSSETYEEAAFRFWYCALNSYDWNDNKDYAAPIRDHTYTMRDINYDAYRYLDKEIVLTPAQAEWTYAYTFDRYFGFPED